MTFLLYTATLFFLYAVLAGIAEWQDAREAKLDD